MSSDSTASKVLFDMGVATIFAREFLEGAIIIGQYRTCIIKSDQFEGEREKQALKNVTYSALIASLLAILVVVAVAVPLGIVGSDLDERTVMIIEGVSKVVAAICILQLSLKMPVWLGVYERASIFPCKNKSAHKKGFKAGLTMAEIRFNVSWNIWREVAECGVFLIPFFLGNDSKKAIPLSAFVGIGIALVLGSIIYVANHRMGNKIGVAVFMSVLTLFLSVGLFVGGCHEFEEVVGETNEVWEIEGEFWSHKDLPMVLAKPFGYSSDRTVLQIACFWSWLAFGCLLHFFKWRGSRQVRRLQALETDMDDDLEKGAEQAPAKETSESSPEESTSESDWPVEDEDDLEEEMEA